MLLKSPNGTMPDAAGAEESCAGAGPTGETSVASPLQAARLRVSGAYATAFRSRPPRFLRGRTDVHQSSDIATPPPETLLRIIAAQTGHNARGEAVAAASRAAQ
ncbi:hypothetical protein [Burkholderia ubonensis]|uniref:hypothetical protein n=1 Tax=Burkholderia ubonensis TaxID=101571 RepID=UPI0012FCC2FF|nr:hypothetical protein [Burkholderia ubonensis]